MRSELLSALVIASSLLLPLVPARADGPDASGTFWAATTNDYVPLATSGTALALPTGTNQVNVTLPFAFPWYGASYSTASVSVRGGIRFTSGGSIPSSNGCLPQTGDAPDIAVFWDNLSVGNGAVRTWFDGVGGRFIIGWEGVSSSSGGSGSFQIQLYPSGIVELHYSDVSFGDNSATSGGSATIGVQNRVGGTAGAGDSLTVGCNSAVLSDSSAFVFGPCTDADADGGYDAVCGGTDCDDNDPLVNTSATEVCNGVDDDCDGAAGTTQEAFPGGGTTSGNNRYRGDVVLASQDTWLDAVEFWLSPGNNAVTVSVYEGAAADGPFTRIAQQPAVVAAGGYGWRSSGPLSLELSAGTYYGFLAEWSGNVGYGVTTNPTLPTALSFGSVVRGITNSGAAPSTLTSSSTTTSYGYQVRFTIGGDVDADGDGVAICAGDCDDDAPNAYPLAPELCDGLDSNCDGVVSPLETDVDGDGAPVCLGDCDDNDPTVSPLLTEVCDGADTDCDGSTPANETDADADGVLACDDCDDADGAVSPGATEVCDGADNNCDFAFGQLAATSAWTDTSSGGSRLRGNLWEMSSSVLLGSLEAYLDAPVGETLTFVVYSGTGTSGTYNRVATRTMTTTATGPAWHSSPSFDLSLAGAGWYALVVHWSSENVTYGWTEPAGLPINFGFATQRAGVTGSGATAPSTLAMGSSTNTVNYPFRINAAAETDGDADGAPICADCDDANSAISPLLPELCNGIDDDCDPGTLEGVDGDGDGATACDGDCDDGDATSAPGEVEVCDGADNDCDGAVPADEADADGDGAATCDGDCDDTEGTVGPGAPELCDGLDNDCVGGANADPAGEIDGDGDGSLSCADCDDGSALVAPGLAEVCDGLDNDCDPGTDEGVDADGDGATTCAGDCDDANATVAPGLTELCDLLDNDCDGLANAGGQAELDGDSDGAPNCVDCDDADAANFPANVELCDGQDNDCDGAPVATEVDADNDGALACADCDDADAANFPGNPELCDGQDNDCDVGTVGEDDADGDGAPLCLDCDDDDGANLPGGVEVCDGQDNDCDSGTSDALDGDGDGLSVCAGDCDDGEADVFPGNPEECDTLDNDCDPGTDEEVDGDGDGAAVCDGDCDDGDPEIYDGAPELCDGQDGDCDGVVPSDESDADADGQRPCGGDCDDNDALTYDGADESCDGLDNDCDGDVPEDEFDGDEDLQAPCAGDCDDEDPTTYDGAAELCDQRDNDCDGTDADELSDEDDDGLSPCDGDCDDRFDTIYPGAPELCNGLDDDCDGDVPASEGDEDLDGYVACEDDCDDFNSATNPGAVEGCDGADNDCDGAVPADEADADGDGWLACGEDCDDTSASARPGGVEDTTPLCIDGLDNDCDGGADADDLDCDGLIPDPPVDEPGCTCETSVGGGSAGWLALGLVPLLARRRRARAA